MTEEKEMEVQPYLSLRFTFIAKMFIVKQKTQMMKLYKYVNYLQQSNFQTATFQKLPGL